MAVSFDVVAYLRRRFPLERLRRLHTGYEGPGLATCDDPKLAEIGRLLAEIAEREGITEGRPE